MEEHKGKRRRFIAGKKTGSNKILKEDEHVLHMWQPFSFEVKKGYDYRRTNPISRLTSSLLKTVAVPVLSIFDRIVLVPALTAGKTCAVLKIPVRSLSAIMFTYWTAL